jgi:RNA polymerase sigma-70 factor, ECF subfamily
MSGMKPADPAGRSNEEMEAPARSTSADTDGDARRPAAGAEAEAERELVEQARRGDQGAFRMLVDLHRDRAYGLAFRITRCREEAEDAAQEAFLRAWLALPRFRGEASFGTWLHRIVARRALDRAAAHKTRAAREAEVEAAERLPAPGLSESRDLVLARRLERLMGCLNPRERAAIQLFYGEDLPVREVAALLDTPENTVKTHLRRARAALREAWLCEEGRAR